MPVAEAQGGAGEQKQGAEQEGGQGASHAASTRQPAVLRDSPSLLPGSTLGEEGPGGSSRSRAGGQAPPSATRPGMGMGLGLGLGQAQGTHTERVGARSVGGGSSKSRGFSYTATVAPINWLFVATVELC